MRIWPWDPPKNAGDPNIARWAGKTAGKAVGDATSGAVGWVLAPRKPPKGDNGKFWSF